MKVILIVLIGCIFISSVVQADEQFNFRKTKWGMTQDEVVSSEHFKTDGIKDNGKSITYKNVKILNDIHGSLEYYFNENKLTSAAYTIIAKNYNEAFNIFVSLKESLKRKYGDAHKEHSCCPEGEIRFILEKMKSHSGTADISLDFRNTRTYLVIDWIDVKDFYGISISYSDRSYLEKIHKMIDDNIFGDTSNL